MVEYAGKINGESKTFYLQFTYPFFKQITTYWLKLAIQIMYFLNALFFLFYKENIADILLRFQQMK